MLSALNIKIHMDNYVVDVKLFRVVDMSEDRPVKRHTHSSFEYHIIKNGRCRVKLDNGTFEANIGDFHKNCASFCKGSDPTSGASIDLCKQIYGCSR
jgi:hypothetical protein